MRPTVRLLAKFVFWLMPRCRSDWAQAMIAESEMAEDGIAVHWILGCLRGAAMERLRDNSMNLIATLLIGLSIILFFEWHTDEDSVTLPVLLLVAFVSGWIAPRRFLIAGIFLGLAIAVAHALSLVTGMMVPRYQRQAPSVGDLLSMTLLVVPSIVVAFAGSRVGRVAPLAK